jgi:outer membrane translocation and assembly module TamA
LNAEYRWPVHPMLDLAALIEAGKVGPHLGDMDLRNLEHDIGIGLRAHTRTALLLTLDAAHSREGFAFTIGFNGGF